MSSSTGSRYNSNVSIEAATKLYELIESLDTTDNGQIQASAQSITQFEQFLQVQHNLNSLVQVQSFCATTNDHTSLSALNEGLTTLIELANITPILQQYVKPLISDLISSHNIKVFYRCFNNEHTLITIPALKLLTAIVAFNNGGYVDEFLENFDLSSKYLADLFFPTKGVVKLRAMGKSHTTVRHYMSLFWITLCYNASPLARTDLLLNNKKINHNWFKFINEFDNTEVIQKVLFFVEEKILKEPAYRKMTKCKILGDFTLSKFVDLYKNEDVRENVHKLLLQITTDEENGLLFHDYRTWFDEVPLNCLPANTTFNNAGVLIAIGESKFKINNKIIYNILTSLHPWSDSLHMKLVISTLESAPELSAPYTMHLFFNNGAHDPKLTSFYIGQTLVLTKIVQLPIPGDFISMVQKYTENATMDASIGSNLALYFSTKILMEVICPSALNRSSITKGLTASHGMIRHLTAQLVIAIFQKFSKVYKLLKSNENSILSSLRNELEETLVNLKLPDPTVFVGITNECLKAENVNKLLLLNYMKVAEYYHQVLNTDVLLQLGKINQIVGIEIENGNNTTSSAKLSDIDILLFNSYLTLTANSSESNQQNKWWNIAKGSKNTLFTTLAILPYNLQYSEDPAEDSSNGTVFADNALISKVVEVLSNFLDSTVAFEDYKLKDTTVLNSQAWAIVFSLLAILNTLEDENKNVITDTICKILDESISRSVKTPYKYFDVVTKQAQNLKLTSTRLSPFYVALCEQSKFAPPEHQHFVLDWIKCFSTYMYLLGEPLSLMNSILTEYYDKAIDFYTNDFENYIKSNQKILQSGSSSFENICFTPFDKLNSKVSTVIPKTDIDIIAILQRIKTLIESDLELRKVEELLLDLVSLYGNYVIQKYSKFCDDDITINDVNLLNKKYWINVFVSSEEAQNSNEQDNQKLTKKYFVMSLLNEIFEALWKKPFTSSIKESLPAIVSDLMSTVNLSQMAIKSLSDYLWVLSQAQISEFITNSKFSEFNDSLLILAGKRNIKLDSDAVIKYCRDHSDSKLDTKLAGNFAKLTNATSFNDEQILGLVQSMKTATNPVLYFGILKKICEHDPTKVELINDHIKDTFALFSESIEGFAFLQYFSVTNEEFSTGLFEIAIKKINDMIKGNQKFDESLNIYLSSVSMFIKDHDDEEKATLVQNLINELIKLDSVRNVANLIFSSEMTCAIFGLYGKNENKTINNWLHRATLYITKVFAESEEFILSTKFIEFLKCLQVSLNVSIWKFVPRNMLNSQLEVILSKAWIQNVTVLKYVTWVIQTGSKNVIECVKLVNIFLNNLENVLLMKSFSQKLEDLEEARYYSSLIISFLFKFNIKQLCSFELLFKVVKLYKGTISASDIVLKDLLMLIENENGESWIQFVSNWDLIDEWVPNNSDGSLKKSDYVTVDAPELIIGTPGMSDSLTVNVYKMIIEKTIKYFNSSVKSIRMPVLENSINSKSLDFAKLELFFDEKNVEMNEVNGNVIYDIEFILLLIVNNEDLFKIANESIKVNIRALIDTQLLQLIICGLAHDLNEVQEISKRIISSILLTIEEDIKNIERKKEKKNDNRDSEDNNVSIMTFKERSAFKVYLSNIMYTIESNKLAAISGEDNERIPKLFMIMLSYLVPILSNPGHFLYEKAYRYILSGSKYKYFEIPLYKVIMSNFVKDEHIKTSDNDDDDYYRQLQWMLNTMSKCITSNDDLKIIRRNEVIEQLLNLSNSPFVSIGMEENIIRVFERIVRLENGGDLLIRSFGLMGFVEGKKSILDTLRKSKVWEKYEKLAIKTVISSDCNGKDKRSREWCSDDFEGAIKRVCM